MNWQAYDTRNCALGEGVIWHPLRNQLFWFDILGKRLLSHVDDEPLTWTFDEHVSAAGWLDKSSLLVASQSALLRLDLDSGKTSALVALEADKPATRSNDGRTDPFGGFWIGTMGISAQPGAGAIYRFFQGELRCLADALTIPNAICFAPDASCAYFTDSVDGRIMRWALDRSGWPLGAPETFIDLSRQEFSPDGAIVDHHGCLWNAQWGAGRVARYSPHGHFLDAIAFPASQISCPGFGGPDLNRLFVTSARDGLSEPGAHDGQTFVVETEATGQQEHRVIL